MKKKLSLSTLALAGIFIFGFLIRLYSVLPYNTIVGFDQARDFFSSTTIVSDHDLKIIGPTAGNNPYLHHGVLYLYYLLVPLVTSGGNPMAAVIWNIFFNALAIVIVYRLAKSMFDSTKIGILSALITAVSYQIIQYSGWLSNPTVTLFSVPLFFLGLWEYYKKKNYWLIVAALGLGLSIQFELFFIYLIPVFILYWLLLRPNFTSLKLIFLSLLTFVLVTSTMIATEVKFNFSGIINIVSAGKGVGGGEQLGAYLLGFTNRFLSDFSLNLFPQWPNMSIYVGILMVGILIYKLVAVKKSEKSKYIFLAIYLFSPAIMLLLGYHNAPWFLIGLPPAIAILSGYVFSQVKGVLILSLIVLLIAYGNITFLAKTKGGAQALLEPDNAAVLSRQVSAIDYTYQASNGEPFVINTLTNPLYINAVWAYHYNWYGREKYGYLPTWGGGDQIHPYDTLIKFTGTEKFLYLIMDDTFRIAPVFKSSLIEWAQKISSFVEERNFGGISVQKRLILVNTHTSK